MPKGSNKQYDWAELHIGLMQLIRVGNRAGKSHMNYMAELHTGLQLHAAHS